MVGAVGRWRRWAGLINRDVLAIWLAVRDPRVPWYAKLLAALVASYALSPIDLIPDFIPVLGLIDDLVILPLGVMAVVRLIPPPLMAEFRVEADRLIARHRPRLVWGAVIIVGIWLAAAVAAVWWLASLFAG